MSAPDSPALSAEFSALLRAVRIDVDGDLIAAASGVAALLRLLAAALDGTTSRDLDQLASCGVALHYVGSVLRDRALAGDAHAVQP